MTVPTAPPARRMPVWAIVLIAFGCVLLAGAATIGILAAGIIGYGATAAAGQDRVIEQDLRLQDTDPAGGTACNVLDTHLVSGIGTFESVRHRAQTATTLPIRVATTADDMYAACVGAGANMSPR